MTESKEYIQRNMSKSKEYIQKQFHRTVSETLKSHNLFPDGSRILIGCSGGADSLALVKALQGVAKHRHMDWELGIITIDHMIRPESADELEGVRRWAKEWKVPFFSSAVDIPALAKERQESLETVGRDIRYIEFQSVAGEEDYDYIAVAHHKDDQVETILAHLIRGSGLKGLLGMDVIHQDYDHEVPIVRPLLDVTKAEIREYLGTYDIVPFEDPSNDDITYTRNNIRHQVVPALQAINPNIVETLCGFSGRMRDIDAYLEEQAKTVAKRVVTYSDEDLITIAQYKMAMNIATTDRLRPGEPIITNDKGILLASINRRELRKESIVMQTQVLQQVWSAVEAFTNVDVTLSAMHIKQLLDIVKTGEPKTFTIKGIHMVAQCDTICVYENMENIR